MLGVGDSASGAGWELSQFSLEHGVTVAVGSVSVEFKSRLVYRQLCAGDQLAIDSAGRSGGWEEPIGGICQYLPRCRHTVTEVFTLRSRRCE